MEFKEWIGLCDHLEEKFPENGAEAGKGELTLADRLKKFKKEEMFKNYVWKYHRDEVEAIQKLMADAGQMRREDMDHFLNNLEEGLKAIKDSIEKAGKWDPETDRKIANNKIYQKKIEFIDKFDQETKQLICAMFGALKKNKIEQQIDANKYEGEDKKKVLAILEDLPLMEELAEKNEINWARQERMQELLGRLYINIKGIKVRPEDKAVFMRLQNCIDAAYEHNSKRAEMNELIVDLQEKNDEDIKSIEARLKKMVEDHEKYEKAIKDNKTLEGFEVMTREDAETYKDLANLNERNKMACEKAKKRRDEEINKLQAKAKKLVRGFKKLKVEQLSSKISSNAAQEDKLNAFVTQYNMMISAINDFSKIKKNDENFFVDSMEKLGKIVSSARGMVKKIGTEEDRDLLIKTHGKKVEKYIQLAISAMEFHGIAVNVVTASDKLVQESNRQREIVQKKLEMKAKENDYFRILTNAMELSEIDVKETGKKNRGAEKTKKGMYNKRQRTLSEAELTAPALPGFDGQGKRLNRTKSMG